MMSAVEPQSQASEPQAADAGQPQDGEDPQPTKPQRSAAFLENLKRLLRFGRYSSSLRENLEDELARDGSGDTAFSPEERMLLGNILRLRGLRIDDVMIPRADIDAVDLGTSLSRLMELFQKSGHSRMPVYEDTLDDPRGMVHIKDLMAFIAERGAERRPATTVDKNGDKADDEAPLENGAARKGHNVPDLDLSSVDLSATLKETNLLMAVLMVSSRWRILSRRSSATSRTNMTKMKKPCSSRKKREYGLLIHACLWKIWTRYWVPA
jgi:hemolysin (HlyC) family protein